MSATTSMRDDDKNDDCAIDDDWEVGNWCWERDYDQHPAVAAAAAAAATSTVRTTTTRKRRGNKDEKGGNARGNGGGGEEGMAHHGSNGVVGTAVAGGGGRKEALRSATTTAAATAAQKKKTKGGCQAAVAKTSSKESTSDGKQIGTTASSERRADDENDKLPPSSSPTTKDWREQTKANNGRQHYLDGGYWTVAPKPRKAAAKKAKYSEYIHPDSANGNGNGNKSIAATAAYKNNQQPRGGVFTSSKQPSPGKEYITNIKDADILLGKAVYNNRKGNAAYREVVGKFQSKLSPTRQNKAEVVEMIVNYIQCELGGRFLKQENDKNDSNNSGKDKDGEDRWYIVPAADVATKISKALVELRGVTTISKALVEINQQPRGGVFTSSKTPSPGKEYITDGIKDADILLGKAAYNIREGNAAYRDVVRKFQSKLSPTMQNKAEVIEMIVNYIQCNLGARFLKQENNRSDGNSSVNNKNREQRWYIVPAADVATKISKALVELRGITTRGSSNTNTGQRRSRDVGGSHSKVPSVHKAELSPASRHQNRGRRRQSSTPLHRLIGLGSKVEGLLMASPTPLARVTTAMVSPDDNPDQKPAPSETWDDTNWRDLQDVCRKRRRSDELLPEENDRRDTSMGANDDDPKSQQASGAAPPLLGLTSHDGKETSGSSDERDRREQNWKAMYDRLVAHYAEHDDDKSAPVIKKDDPKLHNWVRDQRYHYSKKIRLTQQRIDMLNAIDFVWSPSASNESASKKRRSSPPESAAPTATMAATPTVVAPPAVVDFSRPKILTFKKTDTCRQAVWLPRQVGFEASVFDAMVIAQQKRKDIFVHDGSNQVSFKYKIGDDVFPLQFPADAKDTILKDLFSLEGVGNTIELEYDPALNSLPMKI